MTDIESILEWLELPEHEQWEWLFRRRVISGNEFDHGNVGGIVRKRWMFAALAFRLRDEAIELPERIWLKACWIVYMRLTNQQIDLYHLPSVYGRLQHERYILRNKPQAQIAAAMIAQLLAKEKQHGNNVV